MRIFARHLQPLDPATEVPPEDVLDRRQWRVPPYLYSPQEVTALMSAARTLRPAFRAQWCNAISWDVRERRFRFILPNQGVDSPTGSHTRPPG